jgi:hypothetical protein
MLFGKALLKLWLALGLISLCPDALIASTAAASPIVRKVVDAQSAADEDLYLCYLLPLLYQEAFPVEVNAKDAQAREVAREALQFAQTIREHAKAGTVDPRVEKLYADLIAVAELREQSLRSADRAANAVSRETMGPGLKKSAGLGMVAGLAAARFHEEFRKLNTQDKPADDALVSLGVGAVVAIGSAIIGVSSEIQSVRDQEASVREREMAGLKQLCIEVEARQRNTLIELIKERGWTDVEPPGEAQTKRVERYQRAIASRRKEELLLAAREAMAANPRNYFLCLELEEALATKTNRTSAELIEASRRLVHASRLVPDAAIYDDHRLVALRSSAIHASLALGQESSVAGERWEPNETSKYVVATLEDLSRRLPQDQLPGWNLLRAFAYLSNRQLTNAEALVSGLRENEVKLARLVPQWVGAVDVLQAGIQSVKGDAEGGLKSLSKAASVGAPVTKDWWTDADYRNIRTSHPKEFAELLAVKAAWTIEFGVFNDDVVLQNNSGFDLSGIRVRLKGQSGAKGFDVELTAERIPRGQVVRWKNALSIPNDPGITGTLEFDCDQARTKVAAEFVR